jgi:hypothetical protein
MLFVIESKTVLSEKHAVTATRILASNFATASFTTSSRSDASFGGMSINVKNMVWQDEDKIISITFSHDKVKAKSQIGL